MFTKYDSSNLTSSLFTKYVTENDVALIETSQINSTWDTDVNLQKLAGLYLEKRLVMHEEFFCMFLTRDLKKSSIFDFLSSLNEDKLIKFSTRW
jgi:hypothetical protein